MENEISEFDFLKFSKEAFSLNIPRDEKIIFSDAIKKKSPRFLGGWQDRNLVITDKAIYNFEKRKKKRRFELKDIQGITVSKITDEFVIHGVNEDHDYQYMSAKKKTIVEIISQHFYNIYEKELSLFEMTTKTLDSFVTTKKEKKKDVNKSKMPISGRIRISDYIYGTTNQIQQRQKETSLTKTPKIISNEPVTIKDFEFLKTIGRGSCGKIVLVKYNKTGELYAIKNMRKDKLVSEQITSFALLEKKILSFDESPFLLSLSFFFQTPERIYFVTPYIPGGDLYQKLKVKGVLDENEVKLISAQVAIALDHLHSQNIAYRDLKPENILINDDGYIVLCDFGSAVMLERDEKEYSFAGIEEYASPEMISGAGHNYTTDWWSFGILIYELLYGFTPFAQENIDKEENEDENNEDKEEGEGGENEKAKKARLERERALIQFAEVKFPREPKVSKEAMNLISKLLNKNPQERIGAKGGLAQIQKDPFYGGTLDFEGVKKKTLKVAKLKIDNKEDASNFDPTFLGEPVTDSPVNQWIEKHQEWFADFSKEED